ncbi:MAG: ParB/RepB/Spo0J family partition protein [Syntrophorhabdales bacterium]
MDTNVCYIRTDMIQPNRRLCYGQAEIELFFSMMRSGIRTAPITVLFDGEYFRILDGEKRWRAAKKLGMTSIEAMIVGLR